eukprot:GHVU01055118.1.p1 GENE.GHVU01055118.1~~GHVU01055118.1.p1  ORF type:complete len:462 (+),score=10.55 GHVU01055118.1:55-1440(+)
MFNSENYNDILHMVTLRERRWMQWRHLQVVVIALLLITGVISETIHCRSNADCPVRGRCVKDECSRCVCEKGFQLQYVFGGNELDWQCVKAPQPLRVGKSCDPSHDVCPTGSACNPSIRACACVANTKPVNRGEYCRLGNYGEHCRAESDCDANLGFVCSKGKCKCHPSYRRPDKWTKFLIKKWSNTSPGGDSIQSCVARVVGNRCRDNGQCAAIGGSGAQCSQCGLCECLITGHVPDILGTKCGPASHLGDTCSLPWKSVCDGKRGLQCGDVCSIYKYDFTSKKCTCSQMHDTVGNKCVPKTVGSVCHTDLDCMPVREGFGYCHRGKCAANSTGSSKHYHPVMVTRKCAPPGGRKRDHVILHTPAGSTSKSSSRSNELDINLITFDPENSKEKTTEVTDNTIVRLPPDRKKKKKESHMTIVNEVDTGKQLSRAVLSAATIVHTSSLSLGVALVIMTWLIT